MPTAREICGQLKSPAPAGRVHTLVGVAVAAALSAALAFLPRRYPVVGGSCVARVSHRERERDQTDFVRCPDRHGHRGCGTRATEAAAREVGRSTSRNRCGPDRRRYIGSDRRCRSRCPAKSPRPTVSPGHVRRPTVRLRRPIAPTRRSSAISRRARIRPPRSAAEIHAAQSRVEQASN
jgi:hypothetical protein